jgi:8-oxo-dGTP pyrophosphatase MutT (NUDIX family)
MTTSRIRHAARVILLDESGRILLFRGWDPTLDQGVTWWFTPGGGLHNDESNAAAAVRELAEETGLVLDSVRGPVNERVVDFHFEGVAFHQIEQYFTATVPSFEIDQSRWTERELRSVGEARWWTVAELESTTETVYPENLLDLLANLA